MRGPITVIAASVIALFAIGAGTPVGAGVSYTRVVSTDGNGCAGATSANRYSSIDAALADAQPNDSIWVCAGTYTEPTPLMTVAGVSLLGPGSTAADDGTATVKISDPQNTGVIADADNVTVSGFTFDLTTAGQPSTGATGFGANVEISDNVILDATSYAIYFDYNGPYRFNRNAIETDSDTYAIYCLCLNSEINENTISDTGQLPINGVSIPGSGNTFSGNTLLGADVTMYGPNNTFMGNTLDGQGTSRGFSIGFGAGIVFSANTVKNIPSSFYALSVDTGSGFAAEVTIMKNTFDSVFSAIILDDQGGNGITTTIGGAPGDANTFVNSGSDPNDAYDLLSLDGVSQDQNAENNNWGLCTSDEIAAEIQDHADAPSLGTVDFTPFIVPDSCGQPSPTPVTPIQGDADCSGQITTTDAGVILEETSQLVSPCSHSAGLHISRDDVNCDGSVDGRDALDILLHIAELGEVGVPNGCPAVGQPLID